MKSYDHEHIVSFEETNLVGNVYYANHVRWQGHCREMFLRDHAPEVLQRLSQDLRLVTLRCSCEYFDQLFAFDQVIVRMTLHEMVQNRIDMRFDYLRRKDGKDHLVARGAQEVACMSQEGTEVKPCPIPDSLRVALEAYRASQA